MQYDRHVWQRTEYLLEMILEVLGIGNEVALSSFAAISLPVLDLTDWYAIGDELI